MLVALLRKSLGTSSMLLHHGVGSGKVHLHSYWMVRLPPTGAWNQPKKPGTGQFLGETVIYRWWNKMLLGNSY